MKILTICLMCLVLVSCVSGYYYSKPTYSFDNSIEVHEWGDSQQHLEPVKTLVTKDEWNQIFKDYQSGILTQQEASKKLRSVKI
jgi:hypothetical protein